MPRVPKNTRKKIKRSEISEQGGVGIGGAVLCFAGFYLLFVAVFLVWREAYGWAESQRWFDLQEIEVSGIQHATRSEVISYSKLKLGVSIFDVDVEKSARRIEELPWIKKAGVFRRLPDSLLVEVEEYKPTGLVKLEHIYYVDKEGTPFKVANEDEWPNYVMIEGLTKDNFEVLSLGQEKVRQALQFIKYYNKHPMAELAPLKRITHKYNGIEASVGEGPTQLVLGKSNLQDALDRALKLWRHFAEQNMVAGTIHLDNRKHPDRLSVQIRQAEREKINGEEN